MARRARLLSPIPLVGRYVVAKTLRGRSRAWPLLGAVWWGGGVVRRSLGRHEKAVAIEVLKLGQVVQFEVIGPFTRRQRRAAKRAV